MAKYKIENRTRTKIRLQAVRPGPVKGGSPERDSDHDIVIGDAKDTDEYLEGRGVHTRGPRCPSPVVVVTDEDLDRLAPQSRAALKSLSTGPRPTLVVTEIAA